MRAFLKKQSGDALILTALALMVLLVAVGLVIDGGMIFMNKSHLQKTANAAVLSGAQELTFDVEEAEQIVNEVVDKHEKSIEVSGITVSPNEKIEVEVEKTVPLAFSKLFGREYVVVRAHAAAELGVMGRAMGAAPLGIDDSIELEYYKEYQLKVDETEVDTGNFGVLALGGPGAKTYEYNLRHGYEDQIEVGDVLDTQTGNIAGKTRSVVRELVDGCTELPRDVSDRECSRVLLVPVYEPYNQTSNQMKQVKVTGFAYFYITDPMSSSDTSITGMFIKRAGTGFTHPSALSKGAYSIRLTE
ncbi:TadE/TadG family type IV pilus assembly protein [Thalassobacillus hwangdonensis]|uniref:TadE/TadG family type IV pilus assembly protein n=1 Tax=Thalassobacillus hwangdonensis TaxID=546108 RepID=A0ABW3L3J0_9BACI